MDRPLYQGPITARAEDLVNTWKLGAHAAPPILEGKLQLLADALDARIQEPFISPAAYKAVAELNRRIGELQGELSDLHRHEARQRHELNLLYWELTQRLRKPPLEKGGK